MDFGCSNNGTTVTHSHNPGMMAQGSMGMMMSENIPMTQDSRMLMSNNSVVMHSDGSMVMADSQSMMLNTTNHNAMIPVGLDPFTGDHYHGDMYPCNYSDAEFMPVGGSCHFSKLLFFIIQLTTKEIKKYNLETTCL